MRMPRFRRLRRGASVIQWAILAAVVAVVVIAGGQGVGRQTNTHLDNTSVGVGDTGKLKDMMK